MSSFIADYTAAEGSAPTAAQQADFWAGKTIAGGAGRTYNLTDRPGKIASGLATTYGTTIKGDNHKTIGGTDYGNDVYDMRANVLNAVANFPASSVANPAGALIQDAFILPQCMAGETDRDGV